MPRLCDYKEHEEVHERNPMLMVKYKVGTPKACLKGVENICPVSRYTIAIGVGKAFKITDALDCVVNTLEMVINEAEWKKWLVELLEETALFAVAMDQHADLQQRLTGQRNEQRKDVGEREHQEDTTPRSTVRKAAPKRKGTDVRNKR